MSGVTPRRPRDLRRRAQRKDRRGDSRFSTRAKRGSPGFGVSEAGSRDARARARARRCDSARGSPARRPKSSGRRRRAGGDDGEIVAGHVGDDKAHHPRRRRGGGEPAALHGRKMLAHAIHLGDVAPLASSALLIARLSSRVRPGAGAASKAEPPPEMRRARDRRRSGPCTDCQDAPRARRPAASGTGWDASTTRCAASARRGRSG